MLNEIPRYFIKIFILNFLSIYINTLQLIPKIKTSLIIKTRVCLLLRNNFSIDIQKIHFYLSGRSNSPSEPSQGVHLQNENARPPGVSCPQLSRKIALHCSWLRNEKKNSKNGGRSSLFP